MMNLRHNLTTKEEKKQYTLSIDQIYLSLEFRIEIECISERG
jgi:hypothetical protein